VAITTVEFAIPTGDSGYVPGPPAYWSIAPGSALPSITSSMTIDATTQAGWVANSNPFHQALDGTLVVELDGSGAGGSANGINVDNGSATVQGLVINRFGASGINVTNASSNTKVLGSYIGTDITGSTGGAYANLGTGLVIDGASPNAEVGGENPSDRNLIGDAGGDLVSITGAGTDDTIFRGNLVGTNAAGTSSIITLSSSDGLSVGAGPDNMTIFENVISGVGDDGIEFTGTAGARVEGNWIGVDVTGNTALPNAGNGVNGNGSSTNLDIGGSGSQANVISGNTGGGVLLANVSSGITIEGNLIGVGADGSTAVGNGTQGVYVSTAGSNIVIGGTAAGVGNEIANNLRGIQIDDGTGNIILGNSIHDNTSLGIDLAPGAAVGVTA
ncbi:MAG: hypothetical protein GY926_08320, partial [bacterium]|nr:hypothetical protein [bacterium]